MQNKYPPIETIHQWFCEAYDQMPDEMRKELSPEDQIAPTLEEFKTDVQELLKKEDSTDNLMFFALKILYGRWLEWVCAQEEWRENFNRESGS